MDDQKLTALPTDPMVSNLPQASLHDNINLLIMIIVVLIVVIVTKCSIKILVT